MDGYQLFCSFVAQLIVRKIQLSRGKYMKFDGVNYTDGGQIKGVVKDIFLTATILTVRTNASKWIVSEDIKIISFRYTVGEAPTGSSLIFCLKKNGTVLETIELAAGQTKGFVEQEHSILQNDIIVLDITQVGSTIAGSNLQIQIIYS